jgi:iron complex transport system ATP-binding protein
VIALRSLTVGVAERILLRDVDASVAVGEFVAILGANGAGKTTLMRTICGLHPPRSGSVEIDGGPLHALDHRARARRIGFVTSDDTLTEALSVRDVVGIGRFPHHAWWQWNSTIDDERAIDGALDSVHMGACGRRLFSTLSSGERQRVWIAMGLAQATPVLLLDEPTSHLDVRVAHEILELLRSLARNGKTVICVLHDLNEAAAYADRILLLGDERMLGFDPPERILTRELVGRAYGIGIERIDTGRGLRVFPVSESQS